MKIILFISVFMQAPFQFFCEYINYKCRPIDLLDINLHTLECLSKFLFHALSIFLPKTKILVRSGKSFFPLLIILCGGMGRIRTRLSSGYEPAADAILASIPYIREFNLLYFFIKSLKHINLNQQLNFHAYKLQMFRIET